MNNKAINILMVVYSHLPYDARVRREARALKKNGYNVDIICLKDKNQPKFEVIEGINIYRVNVERSRGTQGRYIKLYLLFFIIAFIKTNYLWLKNRYKVIHIHNMPDFLVFVALLQKILGVKVILDLHDPTPEVYMTKFKTGGWLIRTLKLEEKVSISFADRIITTNKAFVAAFTKRGCSTEKITTVMNSPDEEIFGSINQNKTSPVLESRSDKFILMYHGLIVERHGLDIAVKAVDLLKDKIPGLEFWVFGKGEFTEEFLLLVNQLSLKNRIKYFGSLSLEEIAQTIPSISLGIIPNRLGPFTNINFPTRIFEYLYFHKPVIVPRTRGILDYFKEDEIFYFNPGDEHELSRLIMDIYMNLEKAIEKTEKSYQIYKKYPWQKQSERLIQIYDSLTNKKNKIN